MSELAPDPAVIASYRTALNQCGATNKALGWTKEEKCLTRYLQLITGGSIQHATVLDFGCGLGGLAKVVRSNNYLGVDPYAGFIGNARQAYPKHKFEVGTVEDLPQFGVSWDHVVACGVFTRMGKRDRPKHMDHIAATMRLLWESTRIGLHIDFLDESADRKGPTDFHISPWQAAIMASTLSKRWTLEAGYLPFEFCIHILREEAP